MESLKLRFSGAFADINLIQFNAGYWDNAISEPDETILNGGFQTICNGK